MAGSGVEGQNGMRLSVWVIVDDARRAVDLKDALHQVRRHELGEALGERPRDPIRTMNRVRHGGRFAAAIGMKDNIIGEQGEQLAHVSRAGRAAEPLEQVVVLLRRCLESRTNRADMLAGPPQNLPAVGLAEPERPGNVGVVVLEDLSQQEHRALDRRESLEHHQERHRQRFVGPQDAKRIAARIGRQRLGQPFANVLLPLRARRLEMVDAQPRHVVSACGVYATSVRMPTTLRSSARPRQHPHRSQRPHLLHRRCQHTQPCQWPLR